MTDQIEFETLLDMAKDVVQRARRAFDGGDNDSDQCVAFLEACLSEAARRAVVRTIPKPEEYFAVHVNFWKTVQAGR